MAPYKKLLNITKENYSLQNLMYMRIHSVPHKLILLKNNGSNRHRDEMLCMDWIL